VFVRAKGPFLYGRSGTRYIDFFSAAGSLNYGHNDEQLRRAMIEYLDSEQVVQSLDMETPIQIEFLDRLERLVLAPRRLAYKVQFTGPTGTDAVEAALKLARKVTGRSHVVAFMGSYHGVSQGSLSVTSARYFRQIPGTAGHDTTFVPYADGMDGRLDSIEYLEQILTDDHSGSPAPALVVVETVQGEGGIHVAPVEWLQRLRALCTRHGILLAVDDVQMGCGRTGRFFSFDRADIAPDMVMLSKSLSGYGLPLAALLLRPELDVWQPGEHCGTFRSHPLALVTASAALERWREPAFLSALADRAGELSSHLARIAALDERIGLRGIGMVWGLDFSRLPEGASREVQRRCFAAGLIAERVGRADAVLKIMPPLTIPADALADGCRILERAVVAVAAG
jgi:diaminobutyrate-2-oxoglutarate transaminase